MIETGQHGAYLPVLREQLGIRDPDLRLGGQSDAATLSAAIRWALGLVWLLVSRRRMRARVFGNHDGMCLVHGDTPSTLLATLMARRAGIPVAHLESGLRSGSLRHPFPEELIRVLVMRRAAVCFAPEASAAENLRSMDVRARIVETSGNTGLEALRDAVTDVEPSRVVQVLHPVHGGHHRSLSLIHI